MQVINQQLARKQVAKSLVGIWVEKNEIKASEKFGFHIPSHDPAYSMLRTQVEINDHKMPHHNLHTLTNAHMFMHIHTNLIAAKFFQRKKIFRSRKTVQHCY